MKRLYTFILYSILSLSLLFGLLPCPASASQYDFSAGTLDAAMTEYMQEHGLSEKNFAMGWYDPESGESWYYNEDEYFVAGSMYKLPINMIYAERLHSGECEETDLVGGYQIGVAMRETLVNSNNDIAQAMRYGLSKDRDEYRNMIAKYSGIDEADLPEEYYTENRISPRFMINTLLHLYKNQLLYETVLDYMKQAQPGRYFRSEQGDYDIAHKYGYFEGGLNDCGVIFTDRSYLLVVFTKNIGGSEKVLGDICAMTAEFSEYLSENAPTPSPEPLETPSPTPEPKPVSASAAPEPEAAPANRSPAIALISGGALLLSALALMFVKNGKIKLVLAILAAIFAMALVYAILSGGKAPESAVVEDATETPPVPSVEPSPTTEPEKTQWLLSFAGDCTIGTLHEWQSRQSSENMLCVIGGDYSYPLSQVASIFGADDLTMVNLEGALTNETSPKAKDYRFRAAPEYAAVLTEGNVDAVTLANNHSEDYGEAGLSETQSSLDTQGILWADNDDVIITELSGGLKLGFIAQNVVETDQTVGNTAVYMQRLTPLYEQCRDTGCDLVIAFMHWGWEYTAEPESWMVTLAHELADLGCDMVVGSHAHVLQRTELYNGVPIFYSLGNFCYGGNSKPKDMDSVIVQQQILKTDAGFRLGETSYIPCSVSSSSDKNDFCPLPYEEGGEDYARVLEKLRVEQQ